jgi:hypothetical protein
MEAECASVMAGYKERIRIKNGTGEKGMPQGKTVETASVTLKNEHKKRYAV